MASGGNGNAAPNSKVSNRFHSPPVELPSSNAQNFFEEAKITEVEEAELRRKFNKFCTIIPSPDGGEKETFLTLDNFCKLMQYYEATSPPYYEQYFHAMDRNRDDQLDFAEFFLGCCAADPATVHILNSFTGYERSQYIFDFYDRNRSATLEFDEFARLTADCLSLPNTDPNSDQVRNTAIEKARDLGALSESSPDVIHFSSIKFKKFYEYIQNERLRGTSRLFRFYKSMVKARSHHSRRGGSNANHHHNQAGASASTAAGASVSTVATVTTTHTSGRTSHAQVHGGPMDEHVNVDDLRSDLEDCEWHAHLMDLDQYFDPDGDEAPTLSLSSLGGHKERPNLPPYTSLLPPAPAAAPRADPDAPSATDARTIARKVLRSLGTINFDGLYTGAGADAGDVPFTLATAAQLRSLCTAAIRLLEAEDMVQPALPPPVKVFGGLHGQVMDLLSHFRWHSSPVEEIGDILYTSYVFLGDYADRGQNGLEVLTLLLALKVAHPHRITLLRGHHENRHVNYHLGLKSECELRLGQPDGGRVYEHLNRVFEYMSLAAIVGHQVLALGPGTLPPSLTRLDQLRRYKKPLVLPHAGQPRAGAGTQQPLDRLNEQVLLDLFTPGQLLPREMAGSLRETTREQLETFCSQNRLSAVVRSRHIPLKGFSFDCGGRLITINSCLNYCDLPAGNDASILCVTKMEGVQDIQLRPRLLTAQVAKSYQVASTSMRIPNATGATPALPLKPFRWPQQVRDATPGRIGTSFGRDGSADDSDSLKGAVALVIHHDRTVEPLPGEPVALFPAFGPGRPPGGIVPGLRGSATTTESPWLRSKPPVGPSAPQQPGSGAVMTAQPSSGTTAGGVEIGREDSAMLSGSNTPGARSTGLTLGERRSLGPRRSSGGNSATGKGGHDEQKRGGYPGGKGYTDPIVTTVIRAEEVEPGASTPKGGAPSGGDRRGLPRGSASMSASGVGAMTSSLDVRGAAGAGPTGLGGSASAKPPSGYAGSQGDAANQRRIGDNGPRLSLGSPTGSSGPGGPTSPTGAASAQGIGEPRRAASGGAGGRNTPSSGGVLAGGSQGPERRQSGSSFGQVKSGVKEGGSQQGASRGPSSGAASRGVATSPKAPAGGGYGVGLSGGSTSSSLPRGSAGGLSGSRRSGSDVAAAARAEAIAPPSPRRSGLSEQASAAAVRAASAAGLAQAPADDAAGPVSSAAEEQWAPASPEALLHLLQDASRLSSSVLPPAPAVFLQQFNRGSVTTAEQQLVYYLCRLWVESGFGDKDWSNALSIFDDELSDQPRPQPAYRGDSDGLPEGRWTLETYSMWLLKKGRRLRECAHWFRAFDFDQDDMIGVADFLQGLVASVAPRPASPTSAAGLCTALLMYRLNELDKKGSMDMRDLEALLQEASPSSASASPEQMTVWAQRAPDFDFFRLSLMPRLQHLPNCRLRVEAIMKPDG
eukprot:TRINITY_DN14257_c0_g1_i1.p1 TRINITY_DN14257_c0_g1~~TRINITY_DN14257_c0_g1_i1.p1  ORF type:complete len:1441 (-),score=273.46 TRINITY_DN14257_c0_g1_i1:404-4726(-)